MSLLNQLTKIVTKSKKRVGRGYGSGKGGHTSGRGMKGQLSREGGKFGLWFEGGQLPMVKRMPMWRGKGRLKVINPTAEVTLTDLEKIDAQEITLDTLKLHKVIDKRFRKAKIIKKGQLTKKLTIKGLPVSQGARAVIEKLGGQVI
ncbi:MAG: 50S ribosomal protein L15 [Candidatus Pacebacteria bacterium]|nr:50S ribosomal protein L15 [Candidatus Paceibacterota bacterium]